MPELMGAKPDRDAGVRAAAARPCEDRFPRVGQHRMAHLGQPEDRGFARRSIVSANNKPCAFIRCDDLYVHRATANEMQCTLRSEEHTSELQSLMRISYAVFCLKKKTKEHTTYHTRVKNREYLILKTQNII